MHVIAGLTSQTDGQAHARKAVCSLCRRLAGVISSTTLLQLFLPLLSLSSKNTARRQLWLNPRRVSLVFPHAAVPSERLVGEK